MKKKILIISQKPHPISEVERLGRDCQNFKSGEILILNGFKIVSIDDDLIVLEESGTKDS